jgi:Ras-related protein Rab-7L1
MFKVIVIGNSSVGKTSIVNRFVGDRFDPNYKATISADFQTKILEIRGNEIRLQMWDLVGMDTNFSGINRSFCRNAGGAVFVGDLTEPASIEILAEWKAQVEEIIEGTPIPMILCANKCDIIQEQEEEGRKEWESLQTQEGLDDFAQIHGFIGAVMTSAKQDINIIPMMASLTRQMLIKELAENA